MWFFAKYGLICHCSDFTFVYAVLPSEGCAQHSAARDQRIVCDLYNRSTRVTCSCKARAPSLPGLLDITSRTMSPGGDWIPADLLCQGMSLNVSQSRYTEKTTQITAVTSESPHSSSWKAKTLKFRFGAWGSPGMFSI